MIQTQNTDENAEPYINSIIKNNINMGNCMMYSSSVCNWTDREFHKTGGKSYGIFFTFSLDKIFRN